VSGLEEKVQTARSEEMLLSIARHYEEFFNT
jgi:hypothetical protein